MLFCCLVLSLSGFSQSIPRNGIGVHVGITNGVDYKRILRNQDVLNVIVSAQWDGLLVTALYQDQYDVTTQMGLKRDRMLVYYGAGIHYGTFGDQSPVHIGESLGVDLDMGLDQYFGKSPFSVGLEFRFILDASIKNPKLYILGDLALNVRYVF